MPRIAGVDIPSDKPIWVSLTYLFGIGRTNSRQILKAANIDAQRRAKDLTEEELAQIVNLIDKDFLVEGSLRRQIQQNIGRLRDINSYRGTRHRRSLAGSRPADAFQRPDPQGPSKDRGRQEGREGTRQVVSPAGRHLPQMIIIHRRRGGL